MLRISNLTTHPLEARLKLEGQIAAEWVFELERVCRELMAKYPVVRLDFQEVTYIDSAAARMLKRLPTEKLSLINCSSLISEVLNPAPCRTSVAPPEI